jgi:hypothetical protein
VVIIFYCAVCLHLSFVIMFIWSVPNNMSWCFSLCIGQHLRLRTVCFRNLVKEQHHAVGGHLQLPNVEPQKEVQIFTGVLEATSSGIHRLQVRWSTSFVITKFNQWLDIDVSTNFMLMCGVLKANTNTDPRISSQVLYVCYLQLNNYCSRMHFACTLCTK